jgi:protein-L-isoaspartate(D-aspartate) O-methyltransferase
MRTVLEPLLWLALGAALGGCTQGPARRTGISGEGRAAEQGEMTRTEQPEPVEPTVGQQQPAAMPSPAVESESAVARGSLAPLASEGEEGLGRGDPPEAQRARAALVHEVETFERPWGDATWDPRVIGALRRVPRHLFAPRLSIAAAYRDTPQPIGHDQTISQPTVVALMSTALHLTGHERVLEIGTGSGYQAAVLSLLCAEVYSIEIVEPLGIAARTRLERLGYRNVRVRIGDGYRGWPEAAPFDRIILTAAPPDVPQALVDQLRPGGVLVAPVGRGFQTLVRWTKIGTEIEKERLGAVSFVPMVPGKR